MSKAFKSGPAYRRTLGLYLMSTSGPNEQIGCRRCLERTRHDVATVNHNDCIIDTTHIRSNHSSVTSAREVGMRPTMQIKYNFTNLARSDYNNIHTLGVQPQCVWACQRTSSVLARRVAASLQRKPQPVTSNSFRTITLALKFTRLLH
jgi:hypothetical protein